jgi:regulator of RNase E activity RraA
MNDAKPVSRRAAGTTAAAKPGVRDDDAIRRLLSKIPTTAALDLLKEQDPSQLVLQRVRSLFPLRGSVAGRARTLRFLPTREDYRQAPGGSANFRLIDSAGPGDFLVFDAQGWLGGSVLGDMLALRAKLNGAVGVATDGVMRDLAGLEEVGLPVFAADTFPVPSAPTLVAWEADVPVQCGGALVLPGDWILADRDAVVVIPERLVDTVIDGFDRYGREEQFCRSLLLAGLALHQAYPMPDRIRPLFERYLLDGRLPSEDEVRLSMGGG